MVKVGKGGAGLILTVAVTLQPKGSLAKIETVFGVGPTGSVNVPWVVVEFKDKGVGDHNKDDGLAAEPEGVNDTTASVPPHCA